MSIGRQFDARRQVFARIRGRRAELGRRRRLSEAFEVRGQLRRSAARRRSPEKSPGLAAAGRLERRQPPRARNSRLPSSPPRRRTATAAPELGERRIVALLALVDDLLHERQFEPVASLAGMNLDRGERGAEGRQDAALQASPLRERSEAFPVRLQDEGGDARQRHGGQFRQSVREQSPLLRQAANARATRASARRLRAGCA